MPEPALSPSASHVAPVALLADDDPAMRAVLARLLTRAGYAVTAAGDGAAALRAARTLAAAGRPPALLVSDVEMPGVGGVALAAAVAGPAGLAPGIGALLVSGRPVPPGAGDALAGVRHAFVPKPFALGAFDAALARLAR